MYKILYIPSGEYVHFWYPPRKTILYDTREAAEMAIIYNSDAEYEIVEVTDDN